MPTKPLQKTSLVDEVVTAIRLQIAQGDLEPGETLQIEAMSRDFGVSRTPIREAFSKLEGDGLLVRKTGYAATVFKPSHDEVCEFYEMRIVLEPLAARLALPNMTPQIEKRLRALLTKMDSDAASARWYGLNRDFHQTLYEPSGRHFLINTIINLVDRSVPYIRMLFKNDDLEETRRAHAQIVVATEARDGAALVTAVQDHLSHALDQIVAVISE